MNSQPTPQPSKAESERAYIESVASAVENINGSGNPVMAILCEQGAYVLPVHERTKVIL